MKKCNVLLFLTIFLFGISSVYAQLNDASVSGPPVKGTNVQPTEVHSLPIPMNQRVPRTNTPMQGDEYGSFNYNAVCVTGTTGGYVAAPSTYNENVDGSIECWIYPTSTASSTPAIIAKGDNTNLSFFFGWSSSSGLLGLRFGNTYTTNTGGTVIPLNQWSHVAVSWTGTPGAYTFTFFVNGTVSGAPAANAGTWAVNNDSITIGSSRAGFGGKDFIGNIDEVRIWYSPRVAADFAASRFIGLGDGTNANAGNALTSAVSYTNLMSSYTFNTGGNAYDDINGMTGFYRNGAGAFYASETSNPLPYNFALRLFGGTNDYVTIPTNTAFNQTVAGSIDAWIKLSVTGVLHTICSKGTAFATHNYAFYINTSNKIGLNIGAHNYISAGPAVFAADKWYHVAATWTGGPNFTVKLYVNGVLDATQTFNLAMPTNSDPFIIGKYYSALGWFNGYIDELRIWNTALTPEQITKYMFTSCRSTGFPATCVAAWNFDGNLNNFSATAGINGSFSTGGTNNCRLSGFVNETNTGVLTNSFIAHPTVLNRTGTPNPFPDGFSMKLSNKDILDNATTKDTMNFVASRVITSVELFLAIQHTYVGDLTITLTAPNGISRSVLAGGTGGTGEGILTFFYDGSPLPSTAGFFAPWSYLAGPAVAFGNFGSANMQGKWVLTVSDGATGDQGMIQGWGLRFNGDNVTGVTPISNNTPDKFELFQNYPNPFNPVTNIKFDIPKNGLVNIKIFDIAGREISTLVNEQMQAGSYNVRFDGSSFASGSYFYRIQSGDFTQVKKMMLIK